MRDVELIFGLSFTNTVSATTVPGVMSLGRGVLDGALCRIIAGSRFSSMKTITSTSTSGRTTCSQRKQDFFQLLVRVTGATATGATAK
jgi:hypothetical protein